MPYKILIAQIILGGCILLYKSFDDITSEIKEEDKIINRKVK